MNIRKAIDATKGQRIVLSSGLSSIILYVIFGLQMLGVDVSKVDQYFKTATVTNTVEVSRFWIIDPKTGDFFEVNESGGRL
jgi:hypothetical protein